MTTRIRSIEGLRVWDSRARPTVEAVVTLEGGAVGRAIAPAGASRGSHEAVDLRDGGPRFGGLDVRAALANVNGEIARALIGWDAADQAGVDNALIALDGALQKSRLGETRPSRCRWRCFTPPPLRRPRRSGAISRAPPT